MPQYIATVNYNEMGQRLTDRKFTIVKIESPWEIDETNLFEDVYLQVPQILIENVTFNEYKFANVKVGDVLCIVTDVKLNHGVINHERWMSEVTQIDDKGIALKNIKGRFDYNGVEINAKKNPSYLEIPTKSDIESYQNELRHDELVEDLEDYLNRYTYYDLNNKDLESIIEIFKKYDHNN